MKRKRPSRTSAATHDLQSTTIPSSAKLSVSRLPALPAAAPKIGGWLANVFRAKTGQVVAPVKPPVNEKSRSTSANGPVSAYEAKEYNWSGFVCPYCAANSFVACAGGHLACDGTVQIRNGGRFHQCFCGNAGLITGTIKTVESNRLSMPNPDRSSSGAGNAERMQQTDKKPSGALPPPSKGLQIKN